MPNLLYVYFRILRNVMVNGTISRNGKAEFISILAVGQMLHTVYSRLSKVVMNDVSMITSSVSVALSIPALTLRVIM